MPAAGFSQCYHIWQNFPWKQLTYNTYSCCTGFFFYIDITEKVHILCKQYVTISFTCKTFFFAIKWLVHLVKMSHKKTTITISICSWHIQCHFLVFFVFLVSLIKNSLNSSLPIVFSFLNSHLSILDLGLPVSFNHFFLQRQQNT